MGADHFPAAIGDARPYRGDASEILRALEPITGLKNGFSRYWLRRGFF